jgi:hypothetical protein
VSGFIRKPLTPEIIENITLKALADPVEKAETAEAANEPQVPSEPTAEKLRGWKKASRIAKNIGLFFAAPFIALGYVIALPAVGFYMFARLAYEAFQKNRSSS